MKKLVIAIVALSLTIGGCARPMNHRPPREHHERHRSDPYEHPNANRRPNNW